MGRNRPVRVIHIFQHPTEVVGRDCWILIAVSVGLLCIVLIADTVLGLKFTTVQTLGAIALFGPTGIWIIGIIAHHFRRPPAP